MTNTNPVTLDRNFQPLIQPEVSLLYIFTRPTMLSALSQINQTHIFPSFSLGRSATYLKQDVLQECGSCHLLMTTYSMHLQLDSISGRHFFHFQPEDVT
jgi:hypothetical protein